MGRVIGEGKNVALIGASPKQDRYAYRAFELLREYGHHAIPINPAFHEIAGERCYASIGEVAEPIHTVTLYLRAERSGPLTDQILAARPARIIFNPGAENATMAGRAQAVGIETVEDCTLVMLRSGQF